MNGGVLLLIAIMLMLVRMWRTHGKLWR